jgi:hypothetical protein
VGKDYALQLDTLEPCDFGIGEGCKALIVAASPVPATEAGGSGACCSGPHSSKAITTNATPVEYAYDYEDEIVDKIEEIESDAEEEVIAVIEDVTEAAASDADEAADETDEEDEELEEETIKERLATRGRCPQRFEWNQHNHKDATCGLCSKVFWQGYRCNGGGHYVCFGCLR